MPISPSTPISDGDVQRQMVADLAVRMANEAVKIAQEAAAMALRPGFDASECMALVGMSKGLKTAAELTMALVEHL